MKDFNIEDIPENLSFPWINSKIPDNLIMEIKNISQKRLFKKDDYILRQGELSSKIYFLDKGGVKISSLSKDGEERIFWYTFDKNIINEVTFFHKHNSKASIVAIEDTLCYEIDESRIDFLIKNNSDFVYHLTSMLCEKIRILTTGILSLSFLTSEQLVCQLVFFMGINYGKKIDGRIYCTRKFTQKELGLLSSLHRVTVTKILNDLVKKEIIMYTESRNIVILNYGVLKKIAFNL